MATYELGEEVWWPVPGELLLVRIIGIKKLPYSGLAHYRVLCLRNGAKYTLNDCDIRKVSALEHLARQADQEK